MAISALQTQFLDELAYSLAIGVEYASPEGQGRINVPLSTSPQFYEGTAFNITSFSVELLERLELDEECLDYLKETFIDHVNLPNRRALAVWEQVLYQANAN